MSDVVVPENLAAMPQGRLEAQTQTSVRQRSADLRDLGKTGPATSASIAQDELILARSDLATAVSALSTYERHLLERVPLRIRTIRRATRFCSVVPVLIPGVWTVLTPRLRRMWADERELDNAPRIDVLLRELERAPAEDKAKVLDEDAAVRGVVARRELRWLMRLATFAPPAFMIAVAIAIHFAVF